MTWTWYKETEGPVPVTWPNPFYRGRRWWYYDNAGKVFGPYRDELQAATSLEGYQHYLRTLNATGS